MTEVTDWSIIGPTGVCPSCGTLAELPPEPIMPDAPPTTCEACGAQVPDYRRDEFEGSEDMSFETEDDYAVPLEERKFTRAGIFTSLLGSVAERGLLRRDD
jgi:hypothetical protein